LLASIVRTMTNLSRKSDTNTEKQLLKFFSGLDDERKQALLEYAEFLYERSDQEPALPLAKPVLLPRPEDETVVGAIKRLSASYDMVDKQTVLHEISGLMAQNMMQGRPAPEVIDDIEALFESRYQDMLKQES